MCTSEQLGPGPAGPFGDELVVVEETVAVDDPQDLAVDLDDGQRASPLLEGRISDDPVGGRR
jgi:hypothetical protein